ncbi:MAG: hypothetical protein AAAFM81_00575 [Pseudomonadota bacterium]
MTELDRARIRRRTRELQCEDIAYAAARMIAIQEVFRQQQRLQQKAKRDRAL